MCKTSTIGNTTKSSYSEIGIAETITYMNNARTINNDRPGKAKGNVDIVARKKQINANIEIYYTMHLNKNKTLTMSHKISQTSILISI